jgi:dTDP-4-dehydrorhamnose 3,5-epimerase
MIFRETSVAGARVVEPGPHVDERGFFARLWCRREFEAEGLRADFVQSSLSRSERRGTLRGLHFQAPPWGEVKLVRCVRGAIHDVIVDLRPDSSSYLEHLAVELSEENRFALYVPEGCAHGFQALRDGSEVLYHMTEFHSPGHARGVRWDDPAFGIRWPIPDPVMSERDRSWADFGGGAR